MRVLDSNGQWREMSRVHSDPRPRVRTGFYGMDQMLHMGGLGPGTFCLLAGRLHTRKTAVMLNMMANMLTAGVPVLFVGLDEAPHMYIAKLTSVLFNVPHTDHALLAAHEQDYMEATKLLAFAHGHRPSVADLSRMMDESEALLLQRPRVLFLDYLSLMHRGPYDGREQVRIPRLAEDLQAWTNEQQIVTIVLHQVGRQGDDTRRVHGDRPITPEQLMYGGEQAADIIWGTYRPALDPLGNMTWEQAEAEGYEMQKWTDATARVQKYYDSTFLQLIKNRPGLYLNQTGIQLRSLGTTQKMEEVL